ncbi:MAG: hypothetical protein HC857_16990, partial [Synechococcales cyanobacterium RU_4_20]|nr:hypothetical protein [Synechococcales cyanobacterium RU_4_20]
VTQSLQLLTKIPPSALQLEVSAKVLNTQGQLLWTQGKLEPALRTWQAAEQRYRQAPDSTGQLIAQLNQAKALQGLGLQSQAVQQLQAMYQQRSPTLQAESLLALGDGLLRIGRLEMASTLFKESVTLANQPTIRAAALLAQGNAAEALSDRANSIGKHEQARVYADQAVQLYQQVLQQPAPQSQLDARLNLLRLLPRLGRQSQAMLWPPKPNRIG